MILAMLLLEIGIEYRVLSKIPQLLLRGVGKNLKKMLQVVRIVC